MIVILTIFALLLMFIYLIFLIVNINKKKDEADANAVIDQLFDDSKQSSIFIFNVERNILEQLEISPKNTRIVVYLLRALVIGVLLVLFYFFGAFGLIIPSAVIIYFVMKDRADRKIYESGVSRVDSSISFIDFFAPRIAAGSAAKKAMNEYISRIEEHSREKQMFIDYMTARETNDYLYEKPIDIEEITSIYEIALYNEEKGVDDYIYILEEVRTDLQTKLGYWRDYQNRCNEVLKPINIAYMAGVPIITLIMFPTFGEFWYSPVGVIVAVIVIILFVIFQLLINHLSVSTLERVL